MQCFAPCNENYSSLFCFVKIHNAELKTLKIHYTTSWEVRVCSPLSRRNCRAPQPWSCTSSLIGNIFIASTTRPNTSSSSSSTSRGMMSTKPWCKQEIKHMTQCVMRHAMNVSLQLQKCVFSFFFLGSCEYFILKWSSQSKTDYSPWLWIKPVFRPCSV